MKIGIIQICSSLDYKANLEKIKKYIGDMQKEQGVEAIFLPEVFYSMSDGQVATPHLVETGNIHYKNIQNLAIDFKVALIGGTAASLKGEEVVNRSFNFDKEGNDLGHYDKMHLFSIVLKGNSNRTIIDESVVYAEGSEQKIIDLNGWKIGLGTCFDLRFPEFYRNYYLNGANLMTVSSAFTVPTGQAHWETLVRARAIENQSYVVAVNQWGEHNEKIKTYGHSLVIDPWGKVLLDLRDGEKFGVVELDLCEVEKIRTRMNITPKMKI